MLMEDHSHVLQEEKALMFEELCILLSSSSLNTKNL
jgi:hypothetical protein